MLQLRPNCECCNRDLPPLSEEALICSFECTFCRPCASSVLGGRCPNCGGELVARPEGQHPAWLERADIDSRLRFDPAVDARAAGEAWYWSTGR